MFPGAEMEGGSLTILDQILAHILYIWAVPGMPDSPHLNLQFVYQTNCPDA